MVQKFKRIQQGRQATVERIDNAARRLDEVRKNILNRRVLIVDDDPDIRGVLGQFLADWGLSPIFAEDADQAIEIMDDCIIWVALIDLALPRVDGVELCRRIRRACPLISCFAITGYRDRFVLSQLRQAGFEDVFYKPFDFKAIGQALSGVFRRLDRWAGNGTTG